MSCNALRVGELQLPPVNKELHHQAGCFLLRTVQDVLQMKASLTVAARTVKMGSGAAAVRNCSWSGSLPTGSRPVTTTDFHFGPFSSSLHCSNPPWPDFA